MVLASHGIFTAYGFWLPNDPRGSWSDFVRSWELFLAGGFATKEPLDNRWHRHRTTAPSACGQKRPWLTHPWFSPAAKPRASATRSKGWRRNPIIKYTPVPFYPPTCTWSWHAITTTPKPWSGC